MRHNLMFTESFARTVIVAFRSAKGAGRGKTAASSQSLEPRLRFPVFTLRSLSKWQLWATIFSLFCNNLCLAIEPIHNVSMSGNEAFKLEGSVQIGIELTGDDRSASTQRGGDGKIARFDGGRMIEQSASSKLNSLDEFTFGVRLKPQGKFITGTVCVQRGPRESASGAFELSGWRMPFIEREHLTFQGMFKNGLMPRVGKYFPAINIDQDRYDTASADWHDVMVTKAKDGAMQFYLDGHRVAERRRASIVPGVSAWAFEGESSPWVIGADADGGDTFQGWIDHLKIWNAVLPEQAIAEFCGVKKIIDSIAKQPGDDRIFGNGILTAETPVSQRYDWVDEKLPAFRKELSEHDPHLPRYHVTLPGEMWNPIAYFHNGKYHLFQGWCSGGCFGYFEDTSENIVWQHLVSSDLLDWKILPMPIRSPLYPNENGTFFVNDKGQVVVYYYGDRGSEPRMAVSRDPDLVQWKSFPNLVRFKNIPSDLQGRHDPAAVFKLGDTWYQVSTTVRPKSKGLSFPIYQSKDLMQWNYARRFYEDPTGRSVNECGQLVQLDGHHVFTAIHDLSENAQYMTGKLRPDGSFEKKHVGVVDYASTTYNCVSTAVNDDGRATQWRFMNIACGRFVKVRPPVGGTR